MLTPTPTIVHFLTSLYSHVSKATATARDTRQPLATAIITEEDVPSAKYPRRIRLASVNTKAGGLAVGI